MDLLQYCSLLWSWSICEHQRILGLNLDLSESLIRTQSNSAALEIHHFLQDGLHPKSISISGLSVEHTDC